MLLFFLPEPAPFGIDSRGIGVTFLQIYDEHLWADPAEFGTGGMDPPKNHKK